MTTAAELHAAANRIEIEIAGRRLLSLYELARVARLLRAAADDMRRGDGILDELANQERVVVLASARRGPLRVVDGGQKGELYI